MSFRRALSIQLIVLSPSHPPLRNSVTTEAVLDSPPVRLPRLISADRPISHCHQVQYSPNATDDQADGEADKGGAWKNLLLGLRCCCRF